MNFKSRQTILSILAGMIVGTLLTMFIRPTCWGFSLGVVLACYLAKVSLPKEGALIGFCVMIPIGIFGMYSTAIQLRALESHGLLITIISSIIGVLFACLLGALYGLVLGKLFQLARNRNVVFF